MRLSRLSEETAARVCMGVGIGSLILLITALFLYPAWYVLGPLFVIFVADVIWAIAGAV